MAVFDEGTKFRAMVDFPGNTGFVEVEFSVTNNPMDQTNPAPAVTALEIAQAISAKAVAKGYPPLVFRGPQAAADLNP
ncbi:hypothetical protein [Streptomyces albipurpureus]|uniref:Uncharacterized protein n=1 Tax=Streptomyces albipurpureus TaxID=2897419 RepID=A0ABT0UNN9_9ACTN|nr:hypothetical protein [Streptomyces sp. CWNU-1]MCM2389604.1 hypothetical protein [Streptomyces sp. CWNU-1]